MIEFAMKYPFAGSNMALVPKRHFPDPRCCIERHRPVVEPSVRLGESRQESFARAEKVR